MARKARAISGGIRMIMIDVPMPRKCKECPLMDDDSWCRFIGEYCDMRASWAAQCRPSDCPIIDLTQYEDDLK